MITLVLHGLAAVFWILAIGIAIGLGIALEMRKHREKDQALAQKSGVIFLWMVAMSAIAFTFQVMA